MALTTNPVSLMVVDSEREAGRGVIWLDKGTMETLGAVPGDVLEIVGRKRTVAKCLPMGEHGIGRSRAGSGGLLQPVAKAMAEMDRITMENARVAVGDLVTLRKVSALPANYVEVMPLAILSETDNRFIELALNGVPVTQGDIVMVPQAKASGKERYFRVTRLEPSSDQAVLKMSTIFRIV